MLSIIGTLYGVVPLKRGQRTRVLDAAIPRALAILGAFVRFVARVMLG